MDSLVANVDVGCPSELQSQLHYSDRSAAQGRLDKAVTFNHDPRAS